jgi:hypothetical protein
MSTDRASDNGAFGVGEYDDSLWNRPASEVARECVEGFERAADEAGVSA